jgi:O-acetyl-ADP-ribose deacetylase (regulator of RNase III)
MILEPEKTSIWECVDRDNILVNTVNCVGVMGKGIAKEVKERWPKACTNYQNKCLRNEIKPGDVVVATLPDMTIFHAATKDHWKNPSRLQWVGDCLASIRLLLRDDKRTVLLPALGCQNGGLNPSQVKPMIHSFLNDLPNTIIVFWNR